MINITEKLKRCPKGFKLYSPLFGIVTLDSVNNEFIDVRTSLDYSKSFNVYGQYFAGYPSSECLLFPSVEQRDWSKFNYLEEGHRVMVSDTRENWALKLYVSGNKAIDLNPTVRQEPMCWNYIVPVEDFDFYAEDITVNSEKSIV